MVLRAGSAAEMGNLLTAYWQYHLLGFLPYGISLVHFWVLMGYSAV